MPEPVQARVDVPRAFRDAAIAGLVAFGILLPLIGLQTTVNIRNELILNPRPLLLAVMVAFVVAISLLQSLVFQPLAARRAATRREGASIKAAETPREDSPRSWSPFALGFAFLFPVIVVWLGGLQGSTKWIDNFGIQILIYIMLGLGLNIVVGLAGLLDLGYVAFYAVGAYSYALLAKTFGFSFWMLLPLAGILSAFWGILLGFPVLRLRGDYLAIVTLAFGEIIRLVLINWVDLTIGLCRHLLHPAPDLFRHSVQRQRRRLRRRVRARILAGLPHHLSLLRDPVPGAADRLRHAAACGACRSGAPGKRCARTRSPAARSASTPPRPSSPPSPSVRCSAASPARSSPPARASSRRKASPSWNWR